MADQEEHDELRVELDALREDGFDGEWRTDLVGGRLPAAILHPHDAAIQPWRLVHRAGSSVASKGSSSRRAVTARAGVVPRSEYRCRVVSIGGVHDPPADARPFGAVRRLGSRSVRYDVRVSDGTRFELERDKPLAEDDLFTRGTVTYKVRLIIEPEPRYFDAIAEVDQVGGPGKFVSA